MELTTSHESLREIGVSLDGSLHLMTAAQSPEHYAAGQAQHRAAGQAQRSVPGSWGHPGYGWGHFGYTTFGASDGTTPLGWERCVNSCNPPAPGWLADGYDLAGRHSSQQGVEFVHRSVQVSHAAHALSLTHARARSHKCARACRSSRSRELWPIKSCLVCAAGRGAGWMLLRAFLLVVGCIAAWTGTLVPTFGNGPKV